jgi:cytochrome b561
MACCILIAYLFRRIVRLFKSSPEPASPPAPAARRAAPTRSSA